RPARIETSRAPAHASEASAARRDGEAREGAGGRRRRAQGAQRRDGSRRMGLTGEAQRIEALWVRPVRPGGAADQGPTARPAQGERSPARRLPWWAKISSGLKI